jgi:hypothetical protein
MSAFMTLTAGTGMEDQFCPVTPFFDRNLIECQPGYTFIRMEPMSIRTLGTAG